MPWCSGALQHVDTLTFEIWHREIGKNFRGTQLNPRPPMGRCDAVLPKRPRPTYCVIYGATDGRGRPTLYRQVIPFKCIRVQGQCSPVFNHHPLALLGIDLRVLLLRSFALFPLHNHSFLLRLHRGGCLALRPPTCPEQTGVACITTSGARFSSVVAQRHATSWRQTPSHLLYPAWISNLLKRNNTFNNV